MGNPEQALIAQRHSVEGERLRLHHQPRPDGDRVRELLAGLRAEPRSIAPKYFYDSRGAALFDRITLQPEYYPTRVERDIFYRYRDDMAAAVGRGNVLIEPGSGSSEKVVLLLEQLRPSVYVPLEITESHLHSAARQLVEDYPWLRVDAICADYSDGIPLPADLPDKPRLLFYPGSTIGNFEPADARDFLAQLRIAAGDNGHLLIGVDLRKDPAILNAAYNDAAGVTADFNRNVLNHVNRVAGSDFDPDRFRHLAFFNEEKSRVEMHLESLSDQPVILAGESIFLHAGERIHTENSYKYSLDGFVELATDAGFESRQCWCDPLEWFSVHLLAAV